MKIVKFIEIESEMGEYEILKIEALPEINIINVYNGSEKNCPYCSSEEAFPDDIMTFKCPRCKHLIRVSDNGWENILCESCKESITRSKVQLIKGKYIYKK
jgi:DNA-directed RNA polymerase subunit RPC12/RpoP